MSKHKFLVIVEKHHTQKVTYEVEATCEDDAHGEVLKGNQGNREIFSMDAVMPSDMINVLKVIPRTEFACGNCPNSYANTHALMAHLDELHHLAAYWVFS